MRRHGSRRHDVRDLEPKTVRRARRHRPEVARLEERTLLSNFVVTNTLDDNSAGSLRSEVNLATTTAGANTVTFDASVFGTIPRTITLTSGQLDLTDHY